ncbi:MAG: hypothetical protein WC438_04120 [Candidatus Pacearchaeota archaeon]
MVDKDNIPKMFCDNQRRYSGTPEGVYNCIAHLDSGRVLVCPYKGSDIKPIDYFGKGHYRLLIQRQTQGGDGVCQDFQILPSAKKRRIKQLVEELEQS